VPFLRTVLRTEPLGGADWGLIGLGSLIPVAVVEVVKLASRHSGKPLLTQSAGVK